MSRVVALPIYPNKPSADILEMFREAKARVAKLRSDDFMVQVVPVTKGFTGKIVAIGKRPDFFCEHYYIETPSVESISYALEWLVFDQKHPSANDGTYILREVFGQGVVELDVEDGKNS
jgi:hypothetical protein